MPNELKNSLNASTIHTDTRKLSKAGSSTITAMIWTISGVVLAACGSTNYITRTTEGDGPVGPGGVPTGSSVHVVDGPALSDLFGTDSTYTVQAADVGFEIRLGIHYTDGAGNGEILKFDDNSPTVVDVI